MRWLPTLLMFVSASAVAAPPGATPPITKAPGMTAPSAPPAPVQVPQTPPPLTAIDPDNVPERCLDLALRAGSPEPSLAQSSRVSLALCIASERKRAVVLCDCEQSVKDLDEAVAPAFAILDEIASVGEPQWQVIALHSEADELSLLAQRLLETLPRVPEGTGSDQAALHDVRSQMLQPLVEPWRSKAQEKFAQIDRIAKTHPELAKIATVDAAVRDSRRRLAPAVATP
jgi:hypothetical protein